MDRFSVRHSIMRGYDLDLSFSIALRENLLETCLENTNVVVDDSLLFRWAVIAHDTDKGEISASVSNLRPAQLKQESHLFNSRRYRYLAPFLSMVIRLSASPLPFSSISSSGV